MNKSNSIMMVLLVVSSISFCPETSNAKSVSSSEIDDVVSYNANCEGVNTNCMHVNMELTKDKLNKVCRLKQGLITNYRYLDYLTQKCQNEAINKIMKIHKIKYEGGAYYRK